MPFGQGTGTTSVQEEDVATHPIQETRDEVPE